MPADGQQMSVEVALEGSLSARFIYMQAVILRKKVGSRNGAHPGRSRSNGKILSFAAGFYHVALIPYDHW
jgi:hypothetical protein